MVDSLAAGALNAWGIHFKIDPKERKDSWDPPFRVRPPMDGGSPHLVRYGHSRRLQHALELPQQRSHWLGTLLHHHKRRLAHQEKNRWQLVKSLSHEFVVKKKFFFPLLVLNDSGIHTRVEGESTRVLERKHAQPAYSFQLLSQNCNVYSHCYPPIIRDHSCFFQRITWLAKSKVHLTPLFLCMPLYPLRAST